MFLIEVLADEVVQDSHTETPAVDADFALVISPSTTRIFGDGFESGNVGCWSSTIGGPGGACS